MNGCERVGEALNRDETLTYQGERETKIIPVVMHNFEISSANLLYI